MAREEPSDLVEIKIRLPREEWKRIKIAAVKQGTSAKAVVEKAISYYLHLAEDLR